MIKPFEWYVEKYNMVGKSRRKASFRFSKNSWDSLMQYRQYEIEDAVKDALELPKLKLLKEVGRDTRLLTHRACQGGLAGQAFTSYTCKRCHRSDMHHNTAIPKLCNHCAFSFFECTRCGESLDKDL